MRLQKTAEKKKMKKRSVADTLWTNLKKDIKILMEIITLIPTFKVSQLWSKTTLGTKKKLLFCKNSKKLPKISQQMFLAAKISKCIDKQAIRGWTACAQTIQSNLKSMKSLLKIFRPQILLNKIKETSSTQRSWVTTVLNGLRGLASSPQSSRVSHSQCLGLCCLSISSFSVQIWLLRKT